MSAFRDERDSLGSVSVPAQALYGAQTRRALENFRISSRTADPALIRAYLKLKASAAIANRDAGVLDATRAKGIEDAVTELLTIPEAKWPEIFPIDAYQAGAGTSQNMNVNEVIANVANRAAGKPLGSYDPVHPNDHVNRSQSTNDTFPTAMRLAIIEASAELTRELGEASRTLGAKAAQWMAVPKAARTHLQDAVPMRLGQEFGAYAATLERARGWVEKGRDQLRELGIGGSAAGTGLNVPRDYPKRIVAELSARTGEALTLSENLCEAMQSQAPVAFYSSMLRLTALELTRICNDLRLLASGPMTGLAEILLPAVQPGSSIMPGKVNPSMVEMANQAWYSVLGFDHTIAMAVQAGQLELNVMMPIMAHAALEATRVMSHALRALRLRCLDGLEPNGQRLRRYFESTPQIATALTPRLGYEVTAKIVKEALEQGKSVVERVRELKLIDEAELARLIAPDAVLGPD